MPKWKKYTISITVFKTEPIKLLGHQPALYICNCENDL